MKNNDRDIALMLVAVEPSADALGADLYRDLKSHHSLRDNYKTVKFLGCGGALMKDAGFESLFSIDALSVMGVTDVARAYPEARRRIKQLAQLCARQNVAGVVFIDGWAFSRLGAKAIRKVSPNTKIYKYGAPQIWASRPKRVHFVKEYFDGVLTLLPFEKSLFEKEGVLTEYIGNPIFQNTYHNLGDGEQFREKYAIKENCVLTLLPGSRRGELKQLKTPFMKTISLLREKIQNLKVVMPVAPALSEIIKQHHEQWDDVLLVDKDEKYDAFAASDIALAASGTVTTELAIHKTPMVIGYKVDPLTAVWARKMVKTPFASIINVMAEREIIPEFIQEKCIAETMAEALYQLYFDQTAKAEQRRLVEGQLNKLSLGAVPASQKAANTLINWITNGSAKSAK